MLTCFLMGQPRIGSSRLSMRWTIGRHSRSWSEFDLGIQTRNKVFGAESKGGNNTGTRSSSSLLRTSKGLTSSCQSRFLLTASFRRSGRTCTRTTGQKSHLERKSSP
uniref:(northern house mosquito) hypothetical protein n=1 Tax=Culex pipiens TaxID=7175 RepID=A0A8D8A4I1_CULPI